MQSILNRNETIKNIQDEKESRKGLTATKNVNFNKTFRASDNSGNNNSNMKVAKTIKFADKTKTINKAKQKDMNSNEKKKGGAFLGGIFKKKK